MGIQWTPLGAGLRHLARAFVLVIALAAALRPGAQVNAAALMPAERDRIEEVVRDYLLKHPEIVTEALQASEAKQRREQQETTRSTIAAKRDELISDPSTPSGGNSQGDVTIVEFFDYRCPYCKKVEPSIEALLREDSKLRIAYKEFPILGPESVLATRVALAAVAQGKYEDFHRAMMGYAGQATDDAIMKVATDTGLDIAKVNTDMKAPEIDQIIKRNYDLAESLGINGTPGFIVGNELVPGAVDLATLKQLVAAARKSH